MKMNDYQRYVCIAVAVIIALMLLFPPWFIVRGSITQGLGHSFLFDPPRAGSRYGYVNVATLMLQWVGVLIIGGILFFIVKDKE